MADDGSWQPVQTAVTRDTLRIDEPQEDEDSDPEVDGGANLRSLKTGANAESANTLLLRRKHDLSRTSSRLDRSRKLFKETMGTLREREAIFMEKRQRFEEMMGTYRESILEADFKKQKSGERLGVELIASKALDAEIDVARHELYGHQGEMNDMQAEMGKIQRFASHISEFVAACATGTAGDGDDGVTETFGGPTDVLIRFNQLKSTNKDLFEQSQRSQAELDRLRAAVAALRSRAQDATLVASSRLQSLRVRLDEAKASQTESNRASDSLKERAASSRQTAGRTVTAVRNLVKRVLATLPRSSLLFEMMNRDVIDPAAEPPADEEGGQQAEEFGSEQALAFTSIQPDAMGRLTIVAGPVPWVEAARAARENAATDPMAETAVEMRRGVKVLGERIVDLQAVVEGYPTWCAAQDSSRAVRAAALAKEAADRERVAALNSKQAQAKSASGAGIRAVRARASSGQGSEGAGQSSPTLQTQAQPGTAGVIRAQAAVPPASPVGAKGFASRFASIDGTSAPSALPALTYRVSIPGPPPTAGSARAALAPRGQGAGNAAATAPASVSSSQQGGFQAKAGLAQSQSQAPPRASRASTGL